MILLTIWGLVCAVAAYLYFTKLYSKFSRHGIKNMPVIPLMGNMGKQMLGREHVTESVYKNYMAFPGER